MTSETRSGILSAAFTLSSAANAVGGVMLLILVAIGATAYPGHRFPIIAIAVGSVLLIQGVYSFGYAQHWWPLSRDILSGALLGGQLISICAAVTTLVYAIFYNARASTGGVEPGPFFAGVTMGVNALLALTVVAAGRAVTPRRSRNASSGG